MRVYYAHHRWKKGTGITAYEIREFSNEMRRNGIVDEHTQEAVEIVDPLEKDCPRPNLDLIDSCGCVVFTSVSGMLDRDTYEDVLCAVNSGKKVYFFDKGKLSAIGTFQSKIQDIVYLGDPDVYAIFNYDKGR